MRRRQRRTHLRVWLGLALLLPALLLGSVLLREAPEAGGPPVRIAPP